MRLFLYLILAASALSVGGCQKNSSPAETPAVTNAVPATPSTNAPAQKPGSGV